MRVLVNSSDQSLCACDCTLLTLSCLKNAFSVAPIIMADMILLCVCQGSALML